MRPNQKAYRLSELDSAERSELADLLKKQIEENDGGHKSKTS